MFNKTAEYYDLIYAFKDYAAETERLRAVIEHEHPAARSILDIGCGTAEHARLLSATYRVDGIDLEPASVEIARSKIPGGDFRVADMRRFELGKRYDVVVSLFSSIGYLTDESEVVEALRCVGSHLADGGIVIVEPWLTPDGWQVGKLGLTPPVDRPDIKICRVNTCGRRGNVSIIDFHYLIARPDRVEHVQEVHELALYTVEQMLGCFERAGFEASYDPNGIADRGLYVARLIAAA